MTNTLSSFIQTHMQQIEPIETASQLAWWNLATTGDAKYAAEFREKRVALRKIYSSQSEFQTLLSMQDSDLLLNRQRTLLLHQYQENQLPADLIEQMVALETEIESIYTNFRPEVNGVRISNNDLKKILVESTSSKEREEAWKSSKRIGEEVEEKVLRLIALRNEAANKAGFTDYYSMRLELHEIEQNRLFELLYQLDKLTTPHWKRYKGRIDERLAAQCGIAAQDLRPWHYHDPFFQEAPSEELNLDPYYQGKDLVQIASQFYATIGLPIEDVLARSDLYERENKNQHAFCICLDRKQDVRMLCNMRDNTYWMGTLMHELGHAVYDKYIDQSLPYVLRIPAHTSTTEASAMLFGRLCKDSGFLQHCCGVDAAAAQKIEQQARQQTAATLLVFARWVLVMTHFERAMYQEPEIDLNLFWWECVKKYQGIQPVPGRLSPDWAAKLHLACAPVYYQDYILGEMTASQLLHHLHAVLKANGNGNGNGSWVFGSAEAGERLKGALYSQGGKLPWEQALKYATGEPLNPEYFARDLNDVLGKL